MKPHPPRTREQLREFLREDPPLVSSMEFADRCLARATIQPGRDAIESARLAIAYEFERARNDATAAGSAPSSGEAK